MPKKQINWQRFFNLCLVIFYPLFLIIFTVSCVCFELTTPVHIVFESILYAFLIGLGIFAGCLLHKKHKQAIKILKVYLFTNLIINTCLLFIPFFFGITPQHNAAAFFVSVFQAVISFGFITACYLYFDSSPAVLHIRRQSLVNIELKRFRLIILTILSSLLFPLALPNELFLYGNPLLGIFCLSFFFLAVYHAPDYRFSALLGMIFGCLSTVFANYWLAFFRDYAGWTISSVTFGYMVFNAVLAAVMHGVIKYKPRYRALTAAMVFCIYEYIKSTGFLGNPWGLSAYPVNTILPLVQFVDITGLWGLCFLMAYLNTVCAEITDQVFPLAFIKAGKIKSPFTKKTGWKNYGLFALALLVLVLGYGAFRLLKPIPVFTKARLLLVQTNVDPWERGMDRAIKSLNITRELTEQGIAESRQKNGQSPDLVVWSETIIRSIIEPAEEGVYSDFKYFDSYSIVGAPVMLDRAEWLIMNGSVLFSKEGRIIDFYGKQKPVPMAEYIPFWDVDFVRNFLETVVGLRSTWYLGTRYTIYRINLSNGRTLRFGTPICFEDAFGYLCRQFVLEGADVLINLTNDAWSRTDSGEIQHFIAARFRSIENRRLLVRATNAGVTSVIGVHGEILNILPLFESDYLLTDIDVVKESAFTPYTLLGDYFPYLMLVILIIMAVLYIMQKYEFKNYKWQR